MSISCVTIFYNWKKVFICHSFFTANITIFFNHLIFHLPLKAEFLPLSILHSWILNTQKFFFISAFVALMYITWRVCTKAFASKLHFSITPATRHSNFVQFNFFRNLKIFVVLCSVRSLYFHIFTYSPIYTN